MNDNGRPSSRPRGRPRVAEPRTSVSTWLPATAHDRLIELAKVRTEGNVSALLRQIVILRLK